jgi:hypothetical protein
VVLYIYTRIIETFHVSCNTRFTFGSLISSEVHYTSKEGGSNSTREAIHAREQEFAVGMHGALHINPYYGET